MKKAKILCTLGPATDGKVAALINAGMDGVRLNLSHGNYDENARRIHELRKANKDAFVVVDTIGPKIRLGDFPEMKIQQDQEVVLSTAVAKDRRKDDVPVAFRRLARYVKRGHELLIEDGLVGLSVQKVVGERIFCKVLFGECLKSRKGLNLPQVSIPFPYTTKQDRLNIDFAIKIGVAYIADSFVQNRSDVESLRRQLEGTGIRIIAKIENFEGVQHFDEILDAADGIMVARGDLGVEMPTEQVPVLQKGMIRKCNQIGKPVITATQMLDSMIRNSRPTRAEANDVFNAIVDGTDCLMLSGETSIGAYPMEAVKTMRRIADLAANFTKRAEIPGEENNAALISHAVASAATAAKIKAIIIPTVAGNSVRLISRFKIAKPVYAICSDEKLKRQLNLLWGVTAITGKKVSQEKVVRAALDLIRAKGQLKKGDSVIVAAGLSSGGSSRTNLMQIINV